MGLLLNSEVHVEAPSSMFLGELKHVFHFGKMSPDLSAYLNSNNMCVLDGLEHRTVGQPDPESLAANIFTEAGTSTTQLPFSS